MNPLKQCPCGCGAPRPRFAIACARSWHSLPGSVKAAILSESPGNRQRAFIAALAVKLSPSTLSVPTLSVPKTQIQIDKVLRQSGRTKEQT